VRHSGTESSLFIRCLDTRIVPERVTAMPLSAHYECHQVDIPTLQSRFRSRTVRFSMIWIVLMTKLRLRRSIGLREESFLPFDRAWVRGVLEFNPILAQLLSGGAAEERVSETCGIERCPLQQCIFAGGCVARCLPEVRGSGRYAGIS
jgi:hypothetical protein